MNAPLDPEFTDCEYLKLGDDETVVIINNFSGQINDLTADGLRASYAQAPASYPGLRAKADPSYLMLRYGLLNKIFQKTFGLAHGARCESCSFSIVTTPRDQLSPPQRIPHIDSTDENLLAVMHYLKDAQSGGTAFYRHRRTGFIAVTQARKAAYQAGVRRDDEEFGPPQPGYINGTTERYECVAKIEAKPDRFILYRGRVLHSGLIPKSFNLQADPARGRLTLNLFLRGK